MSFPGRAVQRTWHLIDAANQTVGRLATTVAPILKGKHKPTYRPNADCGDYVVIINASKVQFSGKKWTDKLYRWHTGYPGGLKQRTAKEMLQRQPEKILQSAILGMLKRTALRHHWIEPRLKIYRDESHPHTAQMGTHVQPLDKHPRKRTGTWHFGLDGIYSGGYQEGTKKMT
jgi:large subunit ribosomal protein L13